MHFMETSEECWSAEMLRAAEAQIEEQKKAWEMKRFASLSTNDSQLNGMDAVNGTNDSSDTAGLLTFAHQDSVNQVKKKPGRPRAMLNSSQPDCTPSPSTRNLKPRRRGRTADSAPMLTSSATEAGLDSLVGVAEPRGESAGGAVCAVLESGRLSRAAGSIELDVLDGITIKCEDLKSSDDGHAAVRSSGRLQSNRKRTRSAVRSAEPAVSIEVADDAPLDSPGGKAVQAHSPRTRSRGSVNINLWTLDKKPLLPVVKVVPVGKCVAARVKDSATVSLTQSAEANGSCDPDHGDAGSAKKVKVLAGRSVFDMQESEPDLDVVG